jgi:hypothetical protein
MVLLHIMRQAAVLAEPRVLADLVLTMQVTADQAPLLVQVRPLIQVQVAEAVAQVLLKVLYLHVLKLVRPVALAVQDLSGSAGPKISI